MRTIRTRVLFLIVGLAAFLYVDPALGSSSYKCKNAACDINAIGHRKFFNSPSVGNWYSTEREKELGEKNAALVEQRVNVVKDAGISAYVDQLTQRVAQNSDADMPITVRIIRNNDEGAFTLFGGHLYLTTGLLLKLQSEGELASVLARGIAHTALRSVARLQTRSNLLQNTNPVLQVPAGNNMAPTLGLLKFQRDFELEADYIGIQYVYKSGYDTNCFLSAVQTLWRPKAFSPFPPLAERLKMLHQEIDDILPSRPEAVVSTPEFDEFIARMRQIAPTESTAPSEKDAQPKLIRHDPASNE